MKNQKDVSTIVKLILIVVVVFGVNFVNVLKVSANSESMRVGVTAILPDNQIDKEQSYFDLLMKPGQEQELEVSLSNSGDEEVTVQLFANTAVTNDNGVVDYSMIEDAKTRDKSLKHSFSEMSNTVNEVKIPKKSAVKAKIKVKMPDEAYKGVIAGGIYVTEKDNPGKKDEGSGGVQIKNKFVYVVGVQLRNEESLEGLTPDLKLDTQKILPKHVNYRNFLGINLQNDQTVYIRDMEVEAKIYKGTATEVLHQTKGEGLKMAPNSNFNFGVDWENKEFKPGKYRAVVTAYSKDYDKKWSFEEEFTIDGKLADKLNESAVELDKNYTMWIYMGIGVLVSLLVLVIVLLVKNNRAKKSKRVRRSSKKNNGSSVSKKKRKKSSK